MQFFLRQEDIGKPRAAATLPRLAELNAYVPVRDLGGKAGEEITVDLIRGFHVRNVIQPKNCDKSKQSRSGCRPLRSLLQETTRN